MTQNTLSNMKSSNVNSQASIYKSQSQIDDILKNDSVTDNLKNKKVKNEDKNEEKFNFED